MKTTLDLIRYIATITVGDEYHEKGEEHIVHGSEVEDTLKNGLKLRIKEVRDVVTWHRYPCYITKNEYRLNLVGTESLGGKTEGDIAQENYDYRTDDWQERWP